MLTINTLQNWNQTVYTIVFNSYVIKFYCFGKYIILIRKQKSQILLVFRFFSFSFCLFWKIPPNFGSSIWLLLWVIFLKAFIKI